MSAKNTERKYGRRRSDLNRFELTVYDRQRQVQPLNDDSTIKIDRKSLDSLLTCSICLDLFKNTVAAKGCLHRFCRDCIVQSLRSCNKECPICRSPLPSKRSLVPDDTYDRIIELIFPKERPQKAQPNRMLDKGNKVSVTSIAGDEYDDDQTDNEVEPCEEPEVIVID